MSTRRKRVYSLLRVLVGVGLLLYLAHSGAFQLSRMAGLLHRWPYAAVGLGGMGAAMVLVAWRLKIVLAPAGYRLSLADAVRLTLVGLYFNNILPSSVGGDAVKIYFAAAGNEAAGTELGTVVVMDRVVGLFALVMWPLLAAPFFRGLVASAPVLQSLLWAAAATGACVLVAFVLASSGGHRRFPRVSRFLDRLPGGSHLRRILDTMARYRGDTGTLAWAVVVSLVAHTLTVAVVLCVAESVLDGGMAWEMSLLVPLGLAANVLPVTPGGLGVGEAALEGLFSLVGLQGGAELILGWRLLLLTVSLGGLGVFVRGRRKRVHQVPTPGGTG